MKDLQLFAALDNQEREAITQIAQAKVYHKGEDIFMEGDPADTIYLVRKGKVLLYKISDEGKEISLEILQDDDIFGENTIFEDVHHTMNAKAIEDTFVCTCSNKQLPQLLANPMVAIKIIKVLGDKLNNYTEQIAAMAFQDVKGRILSTLVRLAKEHGKTTSKGIKVDIYLNHQDLANLVNASRVMVTRTLATLKEEGKIEVSSQRFYLLDQGLLKEAVRNA